MDEDRRWKLTERLTLAIVKTIEVAFMAGLGRGAVLDILDEIKSGVLEAKEDR